MKKVLLYDANKAFVEDVEGGMILADLGDVDLIPRSNLDAVYATVESERPDEILVASDALNDDRFDFGIPVTCYAVNARGMEDAQRMNLYCYGIANSPDELFGLLSGNSRNTRVQPKVRQNPNKPRNQQYQTGRPQNGSQRVDNRPDNRQQRQADNRQQQADNRQQQNNNQQYQEDQHPQRQSDATGRNQTMNNGAMPKRGANPFDAMNGAASRQPQQYNDSNPPASDYRRGQQDSDSRGDYRNSRGDHQNDQRDYRNDRQDYNQTGYPPEYGDNSQTDYDDVNIYTPKRRSDQASYNRDDSSDLGGAYQQAAYDRNDSRQPEPQRRNNYDRSERESSQDNYGRSERKPSQDNYGRTERSSREYDNYPEYDRQSHQDGYRQQYQSEYSYNMPAQGAQDYHQPTRQGENGRDFRKRTAAMREDKRYTEEYSDPYEAERRVQNDLGNIAKPAKLITIYSAKGGVGKTTISTELATFLALTSNGRRKLKVCIVDFNLDFGDVSSTLDFDSGKIDMSAWAEDIHSRILSGEHESKIYYSENEVDLFLQKNKESGVYALLAPESARKRQNIGASEIEVMLNNLVNNGGFDFVICDTGNNMEDSAMIPIQKSDEVLLVLTQDINAASSNDRFLSVLYGTFHYDMNKIKTVINKVRPSKNAGGYDAEDMEALVLNPATDEAFECYAKIRDYDDVRAANNTGEPLVYKSSHEYTRDIAGIASKLIGENFALEAPKKKRFRLFGRKK